MATNYGLNDRERRWKSLISDLADDSCIEDCDDNDSKNSLAGFSNSNEILGLAGAPVAGSSSCLRGCFPGSEIVRVFGGHQHQHQRHSSDQSYLCVDNIHASSPISSPFPQLSEAAGGGIVSNANAAANAADESLNTGMIKLQDWISHNRRIIGGDDVKSMDIQLQKKYFEQIVRILHSLLFKIVSGCNSGNKDELGNNVGSDDEKILVHPNFISIANVVVCEQTEALGSNKDCREISADLVGYGDPALSTSEGGGEDETRKKYLAMYALGRMAHAMCMMEDGPSLFTFSFRSGSSSESSLSNTMNIHDKGNAAIDEEDEIIDMLRRNSHIHTSEEKDSGGLISVMLDAGVPFPLCRFVADLLDNEHGSVFRSEYSFSSFKDIMSDLSQMIDHPVEFLHGLSPDRWRVVGEKLYKREAAMEDFMDAVGQASDTSDDPMFDGLAILMRKKTRVIMVSGQSGPEKSRLVTLGGRRLEKKGWRFLQCEFDRVVNPEPFSIFAASLDEYFGSLARRSKYGKNACGDLSPSGSSLRESQELYTRLKCRLGLQGLGILAMHMPMLRLALDVEVPLGPPEVNESIMVSLFGKLLQALASNGSPILFFIDNLQWADPHSLSQFISLVQRAHSDPQPLSSTDGIDQNNHHTADFQEETNVTFVGAFCDNEVDDNHPLSVILKEFKSQTSINMTNISLQGLTISALNEVLSDCLCLPVRRVRSLSEVVIQKTDGHPLHVHEFIQTLTIDNLLTYSFTRGWEWDADSIDILPITDSVAQLYAFKIRKLPKDTLVGMQILSCFGSQIDQHVLSFVANYDGRNSVDMNATLKVAMSEGLVERAANLCCFTHDLIQKAIIESICWEDLVTLLRKLVAALIKEASAAGTLGSVLFVAVDLINRPGSAATYCPKERALFAELNLRAGSKAIAVPDYARAAKYAEYGISFLSDTCWKTQYDLSLRLYETAILSHFSNQAGDRSQLMTRIYAVFEHVRDFSDKFTSHRVWIQVLARTDVSRAIEESINSLERLGEPMNLAHIDYNTVCEELMKRKKQFSGDMLLAANPLEDWNKVRAMKIMSSIIRYYDQKESFLGAFVSCRMLEISIKYGHCEDSVYGAAAFASALINCLGDIDDGSAWGRSALSLMKKHGQQMPGPSIYATLFGTVFVWKEPIQSTLESLAQGIRESFLACNVEFATANTIYYISRSFTSGKHIRVLTEEIEALARQHENLFGNDASSDSPVRSPLLQFYLAPLYNALHDFEADSCSHKMQAPSFPLDKVRVVDNYDFLKLALAQEQFACFHTVLSYQTAKEFIFRNMDNALKCADLYLEHFLTKYSRMKYTPIYNVFYEGLIAFYFMRKTGDVRYQERGVNALALMNAWSIHSEWNFKNKLLLLKAEYHFTTRDINMAAKCYDESIEAAKNHKFINEEAMTNELAGIFLTELGKRQEAHSYFKQAMTCYKKWGAPVVARRIAATIGMEFRTELNLTDPSDVGVHVGVEKMLC